MKKNEKMIVAFTGGGTGGHIYPGLAVVDALKNEKNCTVYWLGSSSGMDKTLVEKSGSCDKFIGIPSGKLRRYFSVKNFFDIFKIAAGCIKAFFVLLKIKPAFLFSKGGFVSVPPCFAAKLLKIPVYTHECDFSPGLATKINTRFASRIFVSYEETKKFFSVPKQKQIIVSGNPVRPIFFNAKPELGEKFLQNSNIERQKNAEQIAKIENLQNGEKTLNFQFKNEEKKPVLLVLGGSGGAKQINNLIWQNIEWLCERFIVVHQTGASQNEDANKNLQNETVKSLQMQKKYLPFQFIYEEMPHVLAFADLVFCRSGANTLWEAAITSKPMLLLPLEGSGTRGDQVENAKYFEHLGAALVIRSGQNEENEMKNALEQLCKKEKRLEITENIKKLVGKQNPAMFIAQTLLEMHKVLDE